MVLPDRLRADLKEAMRARDPTRVTVLRFALAAIANAEAPPLGDHAGTEIDRLDLTSDDHQRILRDLIAERESAIVDIGDRREADVLRAEVATLQTYLS